MEEQSSEPLEIVNFISEYTTRCEEDILSFTGCRKGKKEIVLKIMDFADSYLKTIRRDRSKKFYYYDMNNYALNPDNILISWQSIRSIIRNGKRSSVR